MYRFLIYSFLLLSLISCSKNDVPVTPAPIPGIIDGIITEFSVTPKDITTPEKASFLISLNSTVYKVDIDAVAQSQSNAELLFASDTVLVNDSREIGNFGKDEVAYNPVKENTIFVIFNDGRKVTGTFQPFTVFRGVFGESLIAQWREPNDPSKPNQKAMDDITAFIKRYSDKDGPGSGTEPTYILATVSKQ